MKEGHMEQYWTEDTTRLACLKDFDGYKPVRADAISFGLYKKFEVIRTELGDKRCFEGKAAVTENTSGTRNALVAEGSNYSLYRKLIVDDTTEKSVLMNFDGIGYIAEELLLIITAKPQLSVQEGLSLVLAS